MDHPILYLAYTLQFIVGIPIVLAVGRLADRLNTRFLVTASAVIFTVGMLFFIYNIVMTIRQGRALAASRA